MTSPRTRHKKWNYDDTFKNISTLDVSRMLIAFPTNQSGGGLFSRVSFVGSACKPENVDLRTVDVHDEVV